MSLPGPPPGSASEPMVVVTFCNAVASPESLFAIVDLSTGDLREIPFGYEFSDHGATGLAWLPDGTLLLGLPGSCRLTRLSADLTLLGHYSDDALDDIHSIAVRGDSLFAVATSKDSVLEYRVGADAFEPVTTHKLTDAGSDTVHVNSVCIHQNRVLVSVFGDNWRDHPVGSPIGAVIDLEDRRVVTASLSHPHTLVSDGDNLYVLGSFSGTAEKVHPDGRRSLCAKYPGYLRGLSFFEGGALVGVSGRRKRSRGLGTVNVAGPEFDQRCGVIWYSREWEVDRFVDLSWFGREIFDVALVDPVLVAPSPMDSLAAAKHRCVQLESSWEAPPGGPVPPNVVN
jgi:hypothetical protein